LPGLSAGSVTQNQRKKVVMARAGAYRSWDKHVDEVDRAHDQPQPTRPAGHQEWHITDNTVALPRLAERPRERAVGTEVESAELPEEYCWLGGGQRYIACAFYTPNYLAQVTSLKKSLEAHGISHFLKRYDRLATWEATTRLKPVFLDYCLKKFPEKDILYIDADAVIRKPLAFFDDVTADISMLFHHHTKGNLHYLRISGGTVYVRNNPGGRRFAELWKGAEKRCSALTLDEDMIYMAFEDMAGVSVAVLPPSYYKIFDKPGVEPVIEHFQASRGQCKWRRVIRKAKRIGRVVLAVAALAAAYFLLQGYGG
jgi:hypothetical protein